MAPRSDKMSVKQKIIGPYSGLIFPNKELRPCLQLRCQLLKLRFYPLFAPLRGNYSRFKVNFRDILVRLSLQYAPIWCVHGAQAFGLEKLM